MDGSQRAVGEGERGGQIVILIAARVGQSGGADIDDRVADDGPRPIDEMAELADDAPSMSVYPVIGRDKARIDSYVQHHRFASAGVKLLHALGQRGEAAVEADHHERRGPGGLAKGDGALDLRQLFGRGGQWFFHEDSFAALQCANDISRMAVVTAENEHGVEVRVFEQFGRSFCASEAKSLLAEAALTPELLATASKRTSFSACKAGKITPVEKEPAPMQPILTSPARSPSE